MTRISALFVVAACSSTAPRPPTATTPSAPPAPLVIATDVYRWQCDFTYDGFTSPELHVPIGRPIRLALHSRDLDHDVTVSTGVTASVPARGDATLDFQIDRPGATITCPTDIGPNQPEATTHPIVASTPAKLDTWSAATRETVAPTTRAGKIALAMTVRKKKGCVSCHTLDGTASVGPSWKGIWGTTVRDGSGATKVVDENFIRESMMVPEAFVLASFPPSMPSFDGQLKDVEIRAIVTLIESLAEPPAN